MLVRRLLESAEPVLGVLEILDAALSSNASSGDGMMVDGPIYERVSDTVLGAGVV